MALAHRHTPPAGLGTRQARAALVIVAALLVGGSFLAGRAGSVPAADPIDTLSGVPVGVEHSPAGAVAAADDYLVVEQQTVERSPARFAALVSADYVEGARASSLAAAWSDRRRDPVGLALWAGGGESFTVIGADRLDWYRADSARVTTWAGQIFWGPQRSPSQVWAIGQTTLVWRGGRWRVSAITTAPEPAPVPAVLPQAGGRDDTSEVFETRLQGFTPVSYGTAR
jgi:hypothetical protein